MLGYKINQTEVKRKVDSEEMNKGCSETNDETREAEFRYGIK